jgi:hypothetical protein
MLCCDPITCDVKTLSLNNPKLYQLFNFPIRPVLGNRLKVSSVRTVWPDRGKPCKFTMQVKALACRDWGKLWVSGNTTWLRSEYTFQVQVYSFKPIPSSLLNDSNCKLGCATCRVADFWPEREGFAPTAFLVSFVVVQEVSLRHVFLKVISAFLCHCHSIAASLTHRSSSGWKKRLVSDLVRKKHNLTPSQIIKYK